ncbi:MAG TPA: TonB-dependent receptor [Candidatus Binatia bacterium]|nr:TonB-dependent receptor [Candidatus Binatia bacterium]
MPARGIAGLLLGLTAMAALAGPLPQDLDPTELPLERLLEIQVSGASKFPQRTSDAPASVTVIGAGDIRAFGYRTLADVLNGVRGMWVDYDRNYSYIGVRGFERPGDYNGRVLLLIDGFRVNDTIYDSVGLGTDFVLDLEEVERIEVIRGPGSAVYGSNAFFGVINVVTRHGGAVGGVEAGARAGSFGTDRERAAVGGRTAGGVEGLLSASRYRSRGQNLSYAEFDDPSTNNGIAEGRDGDEYRRVFGKLSAGPVVASGGYVTRIKQIPTASFGSRFDDPRAQTTDNTGYLNLASSLPLGRQWQIAPHAFYGRYYYEGLYPNDGPPPTVSQESSTSEWWGSDLQLLGTAGDHRLLFGAEYQDNFRQDLVSYDQASDTRYLDDRRSSHRLGVYAQDELSLGEHWLLDGGLRYDDYSSASLEGLHPRLGLIWHYTGQGTLKVLYGTAFRAPNNYEMFYASPSSKPNPGLRPERIASFELLAEQWIGPQWRVTGDAYLNRMSGLITLVTDPGDGLLQYRNVGEARGMGLEFASEYAWRGASSLRASYAWQRSRDTTAGMEPANSPRHMAKLNLAVPLPARLGSAGIELQYLSPRNTLAGNRSPARVLVNLTLLSLEYAGFQAGLSARNLLDRANADPGRPEHVQDTILQDGRSLFVTLDYRYR